MKAERKAKQLEFAKETYLLASFFKMKTTGSPSVDAAANQAAARLTNTTPMPHPGVQARHYTPKPATKKRTS